MVIPGGFTYGDDISAGKVLANELRLKLGEDMRLAIVQIVHSFFGFFVLGLAVLGCGIAQLLKGLKGA